MLTKEQEQAFIEFHRWLYGDTSKSTGTGELPKICNIHEELHENLWRKRIKDNIKGSKKYKDEVFSWLWLGYWPVVVDEPYEQLWVEVWWWIDWIAFYQDQFWNRYSRWWSPIMRDEVCSFHHICKIEQVDEYEYKVISFREDGNC